MYAGMNRSGCRFLRSCLFHGRVSFRRECQRAFRYRHVCASVQLCVFVSARRPLTVSRK